MWKRIILWAAYALSLAIVATIGWLFVRKPAMAAPKDAKVLATAERLERGRYLFEHRLDCGGCHSERDFSRLGGPVKPDGVGKGVVFPDEMGLPGRVVAPNLTPDKETGLGNWTDGEIMRAIREGVDREGNALFPFMPYPSYRSMSDEDLEAVVAYIRSLKPVHNPLPETELALPVALMIKSVPKPVEGRVVAPSPHDSVAYGKYLVTVAGCADCHTKQEKGHPVEGMELAGGFTLRLPEGTVVSANITPDLETGIGSWTEDGFVSRFRQYSDYAISGAPKVTAESFTLMPWLAYSQMTDEDLRAIYRYLRTIRPITNKVNTHPNAMVSRR